MTAQQGGEDAYCTLLMSDAYLPGALVLAHSLRDAGTKKKLAIAVVIENLQASTITELKELYDYVIPVERIVNRSPANLYLMDRPDLSGTFTKINLWRQLQFRKIVYIDADVVAIRAPDELFDINADFAAAPDIGWPDCFNSGVMVLKPNLGDFYSLLALAQRGISFDGADQGLLNMHFRNWQRISFTYNVTPSGHYQYIPAFRHFGASMSMVHFIGAEKPWTRGRDAPDKDHGPYDELTARWWAVYDRHYRTLTADYYAGQGHPPSFTVQQYVKGEAHTGSYGFSSVEAPSTEKREEPSIAIGGASHGEAAHHEAKQAQEPAADAPVEQAQPQQAQPQAEEPAVKRSFSPPKHDWDPARFPPPADSRPEAENFPHAVYSMSHDHGLFVAPPQQPPPKDLWYKIPDAAPSDTPLKPLFPWEERATVPTRVFYDDVVQTPEAEEVSPPSATEDEDFVTETSTISPVTPAFVPTTEPFSSYTRTNAWDEIPDIDRYITNFAQARKGKVQVLVGPPSTEGGDVTSPGTTERRGSTLITDFPTEIERPSLPVTPAPVRRPSFWGAERDKEGELPAAEGVPKQQDWDPVAKLEELTRRTSEVLPMLSPSMTGTGGEDGGEGGRVVSPKREFPDRIQPGSSAPLPTTKEVDEQAESGHNAVVDNGEGIAPDEKVVKPPAALAS